MIDRKLLSLMSPTSLLVNVARGPIVDIDAVACALIKGEIGAAIMDVHHQHPLPDNSPILTVPNLHITPHIAGMSHNSMGQIGTRCVDSVKAALAGKHPEDLVNPEAFQAFSLRNLHRFF